MNSRITSLADLSLSPEDEMFPSPEDWRDQFIYFLLVDRFDDGKRRPTYDPKKTPQDRDPSKGDTFQGGNLKGLTRRLDYIASLGASAVWISPIFKNRIENTTSYHGYGIQDFLSVDPRFGSLEELKTFVKKAHEKGLYVILDIVINHTGNNWAYVDDIQPGFRRDGERYEFGFWRKVDDEPELGPNDAVWPVEFQNPDWYKRFGRIGNWFDPYEFQSGDFFDLKELDLRNPDTLNALIDVYSYWIATADIDGFRLDTMKHVSREAASQFCSRIREFADRIGKHNFLLFDEIIDGDDEVIKQYITPDNNGDRPEYSRMLTAALDFPLYYILEEVIKGFAEPHLLQERYDRLNRLYPHSDINEFFVTFVDNHDQTARQWRRFLHGAHQEQAILAIGYLLTSQGIPSIYYGTEQGFSGGGDSDALIRECMFGGEWGAFGTTGAHFFNTSHPIYKGISAIARLRKEESALRHGRQYFRMISRDTEHFYSPGRDDGVFAYSRILDSEEIVVVFNLFSHEQSCSISTDRSLADSELELHDLLGNHKPVPCNITAQDEAFISLDLAPLQMYLFKRAL